MWIVRECTVYFALPKCTAFTGIHCFLLLLIVLFLPAFIHIYLTSNSCNFISIQVNYLQFNYLEFGFNLN